MPTQTNQQLFQWGENRIAFGRQPSFEQTEERGEPLCFVVFWRRCEGDNGRHSAALDRAKGALPCT